MNRKSITELLNQRLDESLKELTEAKAHSKWHVTFKKATVGSTKLNGKPIEVDKARTTEEAIVKAGAKVGLSKSEAMSAEVADVKKA